MTNSAKGPPSVARSVRRNRHDAFRQSVQFQARPRSDNPGATGSGTTAIEFIAKVDQIVGGRNTVSSSVWRNPSSEALVSGVSVSNALISDKLRIVASGPAYRATPRSVLAGGLHKCQRAARSNRVSRVIERLAPGVKEY